MLASGVPVIQMELAVGDRRVLALHGDGIAGTTERRLLHRLVSFPITPALYGLIHPDLGMPVVPGARTGD